MRLQGLIIAVFISLGMFGIQAAEAQAEPLHIYALSPTSSGSVSLNDNSTLDLDLALFVTDSIPIIQGILKSNPNPSLSEYLLDLSAEGNNKTEKIVYPSGKTELYVVVFEKELKASINENDYSLDAPVQLKRVKGTTDIDISFEFLHGNILKPKANDRLDSNEYKRYDVKLKVNETINMIFTPEKGEMSIAIVNKSTQLDAEDIRTVGTNTTSTAELMRLYPDIFAYAAGVDGSIFIDLYNNRKKELSLRIFIFLMENSTDEDARYTLQVSHALGKDRKPSWYNAWVLDVVSKDSFWVRPPGAGIFLVFIAMGSSLLSAFLTQKLLDMEELNRMMKQIQEHQRLKKKAMETADKKLWQKIQAKDSQINMLQQKMMMKRMLPQFVLFLPLIAIFTTLRLVMGDYTLNLTPDRGAIVAILPFRIFPQIPLIGKWFSQYVEDPRLSAAGFGFWYFMSAIMSSAIIQRVLGINIQGTQPQR